MQMWTLLGFGPTSFRHPEQKTASSVLTSFLFRCVCCNDSTFWEESYSFFQWKKYSRTGVPVLDALSAKECMTLHGEKARITISQIVFSADYVGLGSPDIREAVVQWCTDTSSGLLSSVLPLWDLFSCLNQQKNHPLLLMLQTRISVVLSMHWDKDCSIFGGLFPQRNGLIDPGRHLTLGSDCDTLQMMFSDSATSIVSEIGSEPSENEDKSEDVEKPMPSETEVLRQFYEYMVRFFLPKFPDKVFKNRINLWSETECFAMFRKWSFHWVNLKWRPWLQQPQRRSGD